MDSDKDNLLGNLFEDSDSARENLEMNEISETIIGCAFKVGNTLGAVSSRRSTKTPLFMS